MSLQKNRSVCDSIAQIQSQDRKNPHRIGNNNKDFHCLNNTKTLRNRNEPLSRTSALRSGDRSVSHILRRRQLWPQRQICELRGSSLIKNEASKVYEASP